MIIFIIFKTKFRKTNLKQSHISAFFWEQSQISGLCHRLCVCAWMGQLNCGG